MADNIPFDAARYLNSEADIAAYLEEAFATGEPSVMTRAVGDIARARGMSKTAKAAGTTRDGLYKGLREGGNPAFGTVVAVLKTVGLRLTLEPYLVKVAGRAAARTQGTRIAATAKAAAAAKSGAAVRSAKMGAFAKPGPTLRSGKGLPARKAAATKRPRVTA